MTKRHTRGWTKALLAVLAAALLAITGCGGAKQASQGHSDARHGPNPQVLNYALADYQKRLAQDHGITNTDDPTIGCSNIDTLKANAAAEGIDVQILRDGPRVAELANIESTHADLQSRVDSLEHSCQAAGLSPY